MSVTDSYHVFVLEQLKRVVPAVRSRRMFGGVGIYAGDLFFALIVEDALYLKTDPSTRPEFVARDMAPFRPVEDRSATMSYYQLPEDVLEEPALLKVWAEKAIAVAQRARRRSSRRPGV